MKLIWQNLEIGPSEKVCTEYGVCCNWAKVYLKQTKNWFVQISFPSQKEFECKLLTGKVVTQGLELIIWWLELIICQFCGLD